MDQLVGFLLYPPLSEIGKKLGKMLKYTTTFKVLSAPLDVHIDMTRIIAKQSRGTSSAITSDTFQFSI